MLILPRSNLALYIDDTLPPLVPRELHVEETTASYPWRCEWQDQLNTALREHDGWGWIVSTSTTDRLLFDASSSWAAACRGRQAWVLQHRELPTP